MKRAPLVYFKKIHNENLEIFEDISVGRCFKHIFEIPVEMTPKGVLRWSDVVRNKFLEEYFNTFYVNVSINRIMNFLLDLDLERTSSRENLKISLNSQWKRIYRNRKIYFMSKKPTVENAYHCDDDGPVTFSDYME